MWSSSPSTPLNRTGGDPTSTARSSDLKLLGVQWATPAQMCLQPLMPASLTLATRRLCWEKVGLRVHRESSGQLQCSVQLAGRLLLWSRTAKL